MFLILEYASKGTLFDYIHNKKGQYISLEAVRASVACGILHFATALWRSSRWTVRVWKCGEDVLASWNKRQEQTNWLLWWWSCDIASSARWAHHACQFVCSRYLTVVMKWLKATDYFLFLWRFLRSLFLRLCVAILWPLRFFPLGIIEII